MESTRRARRAPPTSASDPAEAGYRLDLIEGSEAMKAFSRLVDEGFGLQGQAHYLDDFPVWDEKRGPGRERSIRIGVWDQGRLVSCAGVRLAEIQQPEGDCQVALIGAVATAASHRGLGLASRAVALAVEWAKGRGAAAVLLWGSEVSLYERLGFEPKGEQLRAPLASLELGPAIREFSSIVLGRGWVPTLLSCMRQRGSGLRIQASDESWLEAHKNVDWYWLGEPDAPKAYAAVGRGIDLGGIVHEWGGADEGALKTLLQLVRMEHPEAQLLTSRPLLQRWKLGSAPGAIAEPLCLARILDPDRAPRAPWIWGLDAV